MFSFVPISNPTPPSTPPSSSEMQIKQDAAHKYWLSLRGLNRSSLDAITQAVQKDPFVDITEILEKYKSLRFITQKTFDDGTATLGSDQTSTAVPAITPLSESTRTTSTQLHAAGFTPKLSHARDESPSSSVTWPTKTGKSQYHLNLLLPVLNELFREHILIRNREVRSIYHSSRIYGPYVKFRWH